MRYYHNIKLVLLAKRRLAQLVRRGASLNE